MSEPCGSTAHIGGTINLRCLRERGHDGDHEAYATPYPTRIMWAEELAWPTATQPPAPTSYAIKPATAT